MADTFRSDGALEGENDYFTNKGRDAFVGFVQ